MASTVHQVKLVALAFAYECCQANRRAAGVDGQTFEGIEEYGVQKWLDELTQEPKSRTYRPQELRSLFRIEGIEPEGLISVTAEFREEVLFLANEILPQIFGLKLPAHADRGQLGLLLLPVCRYNEYRFNISKNAEQTALDGRGDQACPTPYRPC